MVKLIKEIGEELDLEVKTFSHDWIISIRNKITGVTQHIVGYRFPLNCQVSSMLCNDKAALSILLKEKKIDHVEHELFLNPNLSGWVPPTGVLGSLFSYAKKYNYNVVLKPTEGSGGVGVVHCKSRLDVERESGILFSKHPNIVVSPYEKLQEEYRVIY